MRVLQEQVRFLSTLVEDNDQAALLTSFAALPTSLTPPSGPPSLLASSSRASTALLACMDLAHRHTHPDRNALEIEEEEFEERRNSESAQFSRSLDDLATRLGPGPRPAALRTLLFESESGPRLRPDANEWLYDRFSKLWPALVLASKKGIPLGLSAVAQAVSVRAGLPAALVSGELLTRHYARLALFPRTLRLRLGGPDGRIREVEFSPEECAGLARALLEASAGPAFQPNVPLWVRR